MFFRKFIFPDSSKTVPSLSPSLALVDKPFQHLPKFLNGPNVKMSQATALELAETAERPVLCKCTYHWGECNRDIVCLCYFFQITKKYNITFYKLQQIQYHCLQCYTLQFWYVCFTHIYIYTCMSIHVNTYGTHTSMINKIWFNDQLHFLSLCTSYLPSSPEESNTKHRLAQPAALHGGLSTGGVSRRVSWPKLLAAGTSFNLRASMTYVWFTAFPFAILYIDLKKTS